MKITTNPITRDNGICQFSGTYQPEERYYDYDILADGQPTGYGVKRVGTDLAELYHEDGEEEYLSDSDLRTAIPEAKRIVAERLAPTPPKGPTS